jgi:hypothetical protein
MPSTEAARAPVRAIGGASRASQVSPPAASGSK